MKTRNISKALLVVALAATFFFSSAFLGVCDGSSNGSTATQQTNAQGTATPTATTKQSATATPAPTQTSGQPGASANSDPMASHFARIESFDKVYRSQGYIAWLSAAGINCQAVVQARQPEEETSPSGKISVSGLQVSADSCHVSWPNVVTTDTPTRVVSKDANEVEYKPDPNNGSVLYTNVTVSGPVTFWIDGTNWGQFTSKLGVPNSGDQKSSVQPSPTTPATLAKTCMSISELDATYGIDRSAQGARNGLLFDGTTLAGAVIKLTATQAADLTSKGWTIQGTNPDIKSAWSPQSCRPLS